jgi:hypothetical protein
MAKTKREELIKKHTQSAKKSDWDSLALSIIELEQIILKEKNSKQLKLLNLKLKIYEAEKNNRVFESFDMEYFLNKEMGILEDDLEEYYYDISDI